MAVSSATGEGLGELRQRILAELPEDAIARPEGEAGGAEFEAEHRVYRPAGEGGYSVEREDEAASGSSAAGSSCCSSATTSKTKRRSPISSSA